MNKVICDICGTAYPDTAPKCPICGYAKTTTETTAAATERRSSEGYSAVKGGRFSKQNVRKRTSGKPTERSNSDRSRRNDNEEGSNTGLVLVVIFLLVAIVAVVIYIGMKVFNNPTTQNPDPTTSQVTQPVTEPTDPGATTGTACESIQLSNQTIEFVNAGDTWTIQVRPTPANTTDAVTFESSAPEVVTVDETGLLTAVGPGEATITVTCGAITETCKIKCSFEAPPTEPNTDPTAPSDPATTDPNATQVPTTPVATTPVDSNFTFEFNTKWKDETSGKWDTSILEQGKTWKAYKNSLSVDPGAITWTSDDTSICTVQNGIVTAVAPGKTEIHATYGGKTYTCIVRCKFEAGETGNTNTDTNTNTGNNTTTDTNNGNVTGPLKISSEDMTIAVGEFWWLKLKDADGKEVEVTWKAEDGSIVSIQGNKIYGEKVGKTTVSATYDGVTYTCIVRIKAAQ